MNENLPIDIHYNKLLDWLISRRHCNSKWQNGVLKIRQAIDQLIKDMPSIDSIGRLLHGTYINYYICQKIVEVLKEIEGSSKTLFGSYSSKRLNDWLDVLGLYENENLYLAESAQLLSRYVNYEIPAFKKNITKNLQLQQEFKKKEIEYEKNSLELKDKYTHSCKQLGLQGIKLKKELKEKVGHLPEMFDDVLVQTRLLQPHINYYHKFVSFLNAGKVKTILLPVLQYLVDNGNTTVYEWKYGIKPNQILTSSNLLNKASNDDEDDDLENKNDWIDWGDLNSENPINNAETWNIGDIEIVDANEIVCLENANNIDLESTYLFTTKSINDIVYNDDDLLTILDNINTRNLFLDDLYELESFLLQRSSELNPSDKKTSTSNNMDSFIFQSADPLVLLEGGVVREMAHQVSSLISRFTDSQMKELLLVKSFPSYMDKLVRNLKKILLDSGKMADQSKLMIIRQDEARQEEHLLKPKLKCLIENSKLLKKQIEDDLSVKYKQRKVNLVGEINSI